ncbi:hypothetical protein [Alkalicoccobacillus porphyridii]|uniref:Uncharacterized protein n=1 Tax=Alkalicoccobacillus porphyridii TaxID=2597270 RepID=A0A553ZXD2_9BACI|nr:hypothetical protein [Alkalicoccobacillus porphyridii]TSB46111.1 hypothetical protein FN960_12150 [Alkalicoccobacillus porphyridii]
MTKIQMAQVGAILLLIGFMFYTVQSGNRMLALFIPIAALNILLWILRQVERKKDRDHKQSAE